MADAGRSHLTQSFTSADEIADAIIARTGPRIVLAAPLGLGKANHVINALTKRAMADPAISLSILTALTLEKPRGSSDLERRFIGPVTERLFGGYPDLDYARLLRSGAMPPNITVSEFFFLAGRWLSVPVAQQNYIAANYTHAFQAILDRQPNVLAQIVARRGDEISFSCNPDLSADLLAMRRAGEADMLVVGEVNDELPFMGGQAAVAESEFDLLLTDNTFPLFAPPREPVMPADHAVGLQIARLIPDGGTLQIGIGAIGDAVASGLVLRHRKPEKFEAAIRALENGTLPRLYEGAPFEQGLFGASEMFVAAFLDLLEAGILKREVDGHVLQAGFFLGPQDFYRRLRGMSDAARARIAMVPVSYVNELYGNEAEKRRARVKARFVNSAMMATAMGAVVSDGLEDGRVVSGVGGQYNFVAQAFALPGARSILAVKSVRGEGKDAQSNIRWSYGHTTIPRHLRDIVVTEYGVADLRGKSDAEVIAAMIAVTDSRFQDELIDSAKAAGKLPKGFVLEDRYRRNTPERLAEALAPFAAQGLLPAFPFGTDFTETEQRLIPALQTLSRAVGSVPAMLVLFRAGMGPASAAENECLGRMGLDSPASLRDRLTAILLRGALRRSEPLARGR